MARGTPRPRSHDTYPSSCSRIKSSPPRSLPPLPVHFSAGTSLHLEALAPPQGVRAATRARPHLPEPELSALRVHYNKMTYQALLNCARNSLNQIKKRVCEFEDS